MSEGRIQQIAAPRDIYEKPRSKFVADFVGTTNFLDGTVLARGGEADRYPRAHGGGDLEVLSSDALREGDRVGAVGAARGRSTSPRRGPRAATCGRRRSIRKCFLGE